MTLTVENKDTLVLKEANFDTLEGIPVIFNGTGAINREQMIFNGMIVTADGMPDSPDGDFNVWIIMLKTADEDNDGLPDLTEPQPVIIQRPTLAAARVGNNVRLTIQGPIGERYMLQSVDSFPVVFWNDVQFVTLDTPTVTVNVPLGVGNRFFRLRQ
jgi:hypothetical protein